jgi:2-polyprenyl-3-methyl-5-hydroxy-6-metoxy-1,4-benzoquinol methylase
MTVPQPDDPTHGYDALAEEFESGRIRSTVGAAHVRRWAETLPRGAAVLDLGCGVGVPISRTLVDVGCRVHGIDASPRMVEAFRRHLPGVPVANESVEHSRFFDRAFDGIVAWGLIFLLPAEGQLALIAGAAKALRPGGSLLFTAPWQVASWTDLLTQRPSRSLGAEAYRRALSGAGLHVVAEYEDEGENHYFEAERPAAGVAPA